MTHTLIVSSTKKIQLPGGCASGRWRSGLHVRLHAYVGTSRKRRSRAAKTGRTSRSFFQRRRIASCAAAVVQRGGGWVGEWGGGSM